MTSSMVLAAMLLGAPAPRAEPESVVNRVDVFLAAETLEEQRAAAQQILAEGLAFDLVYRRLSEGRAHSADVETGILERSRRNRDGTVYGYLLVVPESYDPARRYPVAVYLHGGISRPAWPRGGGWWRDPKRLRSEDRIAVVPASWSESKWWRASQIENVAGILWDLKRAYNIDENRIVQIGVSDGGTGAWYFAFRDRTPWAAFLPFIAHPAVLANPDAGAEGALFLRNLAGTPFLAINGSHDPLYPAREVERLVRTLREAGAQAEFESMPNGRHNVRWWPERAQAIEAFIASHPRDALPDQVFWAVDRTDRDNRAHWVVIDELGPGAAELQTLGPAPERTGWVEAVRRDNTLEVTARGVRRYRLLLSPEELDLDSELVVTTNGEESYRGRITPSLEVLLDWAGRDRDRTMLFAAELAIEILPPTASTSSTER